MSRLVWHRRDLRLHDNELYTQASRIYSLFIFDPDEFSPRPTHIQNGAQSVTHGPHFSRHLLHAVTSLRNSLEKLGGTLLIRHGSPLKVIPELARELQVNEVAWSEIPGYYEYAQSEKLKRLLFCNNDVYTCKVYTTSSLTLAHPDDLPMEQCVWERLARPKEKRKKKRPNNNSANSEKDHSHACVNNEWEKSSKITNISPSRFVGMPTIMGDFRRVSRTVSPVREIAERVSSNHLARDILGINPGKIPSLEELTEPLALAESKSILGLPKELIQKVIKSAKDQYAKQQQLLCNHDMEEHAMHHLETFVQNHASCANRSAADVSNNNSSQLSIYLALGILSPRQIYHHVITYQQQCQQCGNNHADCSWILSHMEMRDYFLFDSFRNGSTSYHIQPHKSHNNGVQNGEWLSLSEHRDLFIQWASGQTNLPLVDAGFNELISTGYTSNRVRQNMASVLTKDLKFDWRLGAEWFQFCLEDHCVAANYGNWAYFAGVGGDPKNFVAINVQNFGYCRMVEWT